ncbi:MAG: DUF2231 domain-containing protein [Gammaproteobacteria bacterium]|nr:DUF2231 domain-containing protein [Gammaproteobacteria bacterium]MDX5374596.1 DUF2231 domain-containing protein [Gammaproteobacteria bacterium]
MIDIIPNWHPMFVHFTVALFVTAWLFFVASTLVRPRYHGLGGQWRDVARWVLWLGALFTVATLLAGWDAYNTVDHDTPSHEAMTEHRDWALVTASVFILLTLWSVWRAIARREEGLLFLAALTLAVGLLAATGWRGAELVYRHGLGVMSLPQAGNHDHDSHDHGSHDHSSHDHGDDGEAPPGPANEGSDVDEHPHDAHEHHDHAH